MPKIFTGLNAIRISQLAVALCFISSASVEAQPSVSSANPDKSGEGTGLDEIVVTAQKRTENLQDVPIAISAFTSDALSRRGIGDVSSIAKLAPNVTLDAGSFTGGSLSVLSAFIRGIGQTDFAFNFDPGVGVYVDGVYLGRTIGANVGLFDVERIEVLKGPQGTLFGRNTIGGAVNIVTLTPSDKFKFSAEATTGRYNRLDVRSLISGPLTDTLSASLAIGTKSRDGYLKRLPFDTTGYFVDSRTFAPKVSYPDEEGGQGEISLRGKLLWKPASNLQAVVSGDYSRVKSTDIPQVPLQITNDGLGGLYNTCINTSLADLNAIGLGTVCGTPRAGIGTALAGANVDNDPNNNRLPWDSRYITSNKDTNFATHNSIEKTKSYGGTLNLTYDLGKDITLRSITAYRELNYLSAADLDGTPLEWVEANSRVKQNQFSEELQLTGQIMQNRLKYVLGAYYFKEHASTDDYVAIGELLFLNAPADIRTKAKAVYGQLDWGISDVFGLTAGGRYTEEDKNIFVGQQDLDALSYKLASCFPVTEACRVALGFPNPNNPLAYAPAGRPKRKFKNFSPKIGLQAHIDARTMLYASWSEGYKSGGWTTRLTGPVSILPSFGPEKASTYEVGLKTDLFDRRLRLNGAIFHTDYKNIQLNFQEGVSPVIRNAGNAEIYGAEAEATLLVTDAFTLHGSAGYIHDRYKKLDPGAAGVTLDSRLPKTPAWKLGLSPQYELQLHESESVLFIADYSYSSSSFNDTENSTGIQKTAFSDLSASVSYKSPNGWRLTVGGTNILNKRYLVTGQNGIAGGGLMYGTYNRPAEWYASIRFDL